MQGLGKGLVCILWGAVYAGERVALSATHHAFGVGMQRVDQIPAATGCWQMGRLLHDLFAIMRGCATGIRLISW